jgi:hypothetical protein
LRREEELALPLPLLPSLRRGGALLDWEGRRAVEDEGGFRREDSGGGLLRAAAVIMTLAGTEGASSLGLSIGRFFAVSYSGSGRIVIMALMESGQRSGTIWFKSKKQLGR